MDLRHVFCLEWLAQGCINIPLQHFPTAAMYTWCQCLTCALSEEGRGIQTLSKTCKHEPLGATVAVAVVAGWLPDGPQGYAGHLLGKHV